MYGSTLTPSLCKGRRGIVPYVQRQHLSRRNPADGQAHRSSGSGQVFGDSNADPVRAPIDDDHGLTDGAFTPQHLPGIDDLQGALPRENPADRVWRPWQ